MQGRKGQLEYNCSEYNFKFKSPHSRNETYQSLIWDKKWIKQKDRLVWMKTFGEFKCGPFLVLCWASERTAWDNGRQLWWLWHQPWSIASWRPTVWPNTKAKTETRTKTKAETEIKAETKTETKTETNTETKTVTKTKTMTNTKIKTETKVMTKTKI